MAEASFPFGKKPVATPVVDNPVEVNEPVAETLAAETAAEPIVKEKKKRVKKESSGERVAPAVEMSAEQITAIIGHMGPNGVYVDGLIRQFDAKTCADKVGVTKNQVNRVCTDAKKKLLAKAGDDPRLTAVVKKFISEHLSRPEGSKGHRAAGSGNVKAVLDNSANDIFASLGLA